MIVLECQRCHATLEVDDGFAGGVCRCSTCGTIQTVPRRAAESSKALYTRGTPSSSSPDLDQLSQIVGSSPSLARAARRRGKGSSQPVWLMPLMLAVGGLLVVGGIVLGVMIGNAGPGPGANIGPSPAQTTSTDLEQSAPRTTPSLGPIDLTGTGPVVYLLDSGDATREAFPDLVRAVLASIRSLEPTQRFQVILWADHRGSVQKFPDTPQLASARQFESASQSLALISAAGATFIEPALIEAFAIDPEHLVIASGKDLTFDEGFADRVIAAAGSRTTTIHTLSLHGVQTRDDPLRDLAERTSGRHLALDLQSLRALAR